MKKESTKMENEFSVGGGRRPGKWGTLPWLRPERLLPIIAFAAIVGVGLAEVLD